MLEALAPISWSKNFEMGEAGEIIHMNLTFNHKSGYTLLEVLTVGIVLSVLASLAIPSYLFSLEKAKAGEGLQILQALRSAQKAYYEEHGSYANDIADLDISIPTSKYFDPPVLSTANPIAYVQRTGSYKLLTTDTGTITCSGGPSGYCTKLGF